MPKRKENAIPVPRREPELRSSRQMRSARRRKARRWSIAIWGVQAMLSAIFLMQGLMKLILPSDQLGLTMPWVSLAPSWLVLSIGFAEVVVASLLILPALLRYRPELGIYAAWALIGFMVVAVTYHAFKEEYAAIPNNVVAMVLTGFVLWGRLRKDPIRPKETVVQPPVNRNGFF